MGAPVAIVGLAAVAWLYLGGGYPNLDTAYALAWGHEIAGGALPGYDQGAAPTAHPLANAIGTLAATFGDSAYDALAVFAFVSFGGLVWGVYALGRACYSWRVGLLGAFVIATSYTVLSRTAASYFDVLTVALILLAALLEVGGRRGVPVLAVLGIAGLQRPEAWLLAAGYWLYLAPQVDNRQRLRLAALAAAAPMLWAAVDLIVTGDPLYTVSGARSAAVEAAGPGGHTEPVLSVAVDELRGIVRLPGLLGGLAGAGLALAFLRARSRVPLMLLAFGLVSFVGLGLGGLPLVDRFLFLPAATLAIFTGVAVVGWMERPERGWWRTAWMVGGAALLISMILALPSQLDRFGGLRDGVRLRVSAVDDLQNLADSHFAGPLLRRCERVYLPNHQLVPILSYTLDRPLRELSVPLHRQPLRGAYVEPRGEVLAANAFYLRTNAIPKAPAGFERVAESRYWTVRARGCGR